MSAGTQATYGLLSSRVPAKCKQKTISKQKSKQKISVLLLPSGHLQVAECETVSQMAFAPHSLNPMQGSVQLPFIQAVPIVQSLLK